MLWLIILALIAVMLFIMFHKPPVNTAGAAWTAPRSAPPTQPEAPPAPPAGPMPDTFDFNDMFSRPQGGGDQPHV